MQHCHLVTSSGSAEVPAVGPAWDVPAPTMTFVLLAAREHSGAGTGFLDRALSAGTFPPPNCLTRVNVWTSPPRFCTTVCCPAVRLSVTNLKVPAEASSIGLNRHAPAMWSCCSSAMNNGKGVVPCSPGTQVFGPTMALNVAGSQASRIRMVMGLDCAPTTPAHRMKTPLASASIIVVTKSTFRKLIMSLLIRLECLPWKGRPADAARHYVCVRKVSRVIPSLCKPRRRICFCRDVVQRRGEAFADDRMIVDETSARIFDKAKPPHTAFRSLRMMWPWMRHRLRHPHRA